MALSPRVVVWSRRREHSGCALWARWWLLPLEGLPPWYLARFLEGVLRWFLAALLGAWCFAVLSARAWQWHAPDRWQSLAPPLAVHEQGSPQFVQIDFGRRVRPKQLLMTFQGGFAGRDCLLLGGADASCLEKICGFYPDDVNTEQVCSWRRLACAV